MDLGSHWLRFRTALTQRGVTPLVMLLGLGGGSLLLLFACASQFGRTERVPLTDNARHSASDFRAAQTVWKSAGLDAAQFSGGVILVPADRAAEYRRAWQPANAAVERSRWADVWQSANDRLGQFSGSRERDAAREISRAQVISRLLEELPDIAAADVVWDESSSITGWRSTERARATVYLRAKTGRVIGPDVVDAVRRAVAGSKANLAVADVTVMDQTRMVTYDGAAAAGQSQAMQLAAHFRSRMESALDYIPGVRVQVHVNAAPADSRAPIPVAIAVAVPEQSIRHLAGLDAADSLNDSGSALAQRRREVFRAVEAHLHKSIRDQARSLLPAGLELSANPPALVETIPSPPVPHPTVSSPAVAHAAAAAHIGLWIQQNILPLTAVLCACGALWMLRPRVVRPAVEDSPPVDRPATAQPASAGSTDSSLPNMPAPSRRAADVPHALGMVMQELSAVPPATDDEATGADLCARTDSDRSPRQLPPETLAHDALRTALSKLERRTQPVPVAPVPSAIREPSQGVAPPTVIAARVPISTRASQPAQDLEDLVREDADIVRTIVQQVDALIWSKALFGASETLQNRILLHLPASDSVILQRELRTNRPLRLRDIDAAQATVRDVWARLRQELPVGPPSPVRSAA